jgi:uncharacterized protein YbjT (DUF2867 family)
VHPIRPLVLATNALGWAYPIKAGSRLPLYQPDALTAPIHERDVAAVAVAALLGGIGIGIGIGGMLTGPARLRQREQVAAIAAATNQNIEIDELTRPAALAHWRTGALAHWRTGALAHFEPFMPTAEAQAVLQFLDDAAKGNSPATDTVARILGRPATPFDIWATDHAKGLHSPTVAKVTAPKPVLSALALLTPT